MSKPKKLTAVALPLIVGAAIGVSYFGFAGAAPQVDYEALEQGITQLQEARGADQAAIAETHEELLVDISPGAPERVKEECVVNDSGAPAYLTLSYPFTSLQSHTVLFTTGVEAQIEGNVGHEMNLFYLGEVTITDEIVTEPGDCTSYYVKFMPAESDDGWTQEDLDNAEVMFTPVRTWTPAV